MNTARGEEMLKEYKVDINKIEERLPWGGMITDTILRNKENSLMSVFSYRYDLENIQLSVGNGWCYWSEKQHFYPGDNRNFLTVLWNPHYDKKNNHILNANAVEELFKGSEKEYFLSEIDQIASAKDKIEIKQRDEVLNYLYSCLNMVDEKIKYPELALYLDCTLSKNTKLKISDNEIAINNKKMVIITIPQYSGFIMNTLFSAVDTYQYRFIRRFISSSKETYEREMKKYTVQWCKSRATVLNYIKKRIEPQLPGYVDNVFIFFTENDEENRFDELKQIFHEHKLIYSIEKYNFKDVWWGCIPGIFRANIVPPMHGLNSAADLLL